jgi:hypothetical protein
VYSTIRLRGWLIVSAGRQKLAAALRMTWLKHRSNCWTARKLPSDFAD